MSLQEPWAWDAVADGYTVENLHQFEQFAEDAFALAPPDGYVLDVACGPATLTCLAARTAAKVEALDFAERMITRARERVMAAGFANVVLRVGDGQQLPFADAEFDVAYSMFGLMFFPDRARGLAELRRVLRPGKRAVVSSWVARDRSPAFRAMFEAMTAALPQAPPTEPPQPLSTPEACRAEFEAAGFRDVAVHERSHALAFATLDRMWESLEAGFAPLAILRKMLGDRYPGVAAKIRAGVGERLGTSDIRLDMPALLTVGTR